MQRPPPKKILRRKKRVVKPGQKKPGQKLAPGLLAPPPPKPKPLMDFTAKDPWGYRFAMPMWKLDASAELMKRDPKDQERERVNGVLKREFDLDPSNEGFDAEVIPWGLFREETKLGRRRQFAEALRKECLDAPGGLLGIAQVHFLAAKFMLTSTLRAKAPVAAFPLALDIEETTVKEKYRAQYVLQIDRVFYPVTKLPQVQRFALPHIVVDGFRLLEQGGESVVRTGDKKVVAQITTASKPDRDTPLHWHITRNKLPPIELKEDKLFVEGLPMGAILKNVDKDSHAVDYTLRFDGQGEREPLLGLLVCYIDAIIQRRLGVLGRARAQANKPEEHDAPA